MAKILFSVLLATLAAVTGAVKLTNADYNVVPGEDFTIKWADAEGPVTIRLKSGSAKDLKTVGEITSGQSGESFTWTVPSDYSGEQYAFEIEDGSGKINYSVQFPIDGDASSPSGSTAEASATISTAVETSVGPTTAESAAPSSTDAIEDETTSQVLSITQSIAETTTFETRTPSTESDSLSEQEETATDSSEPSATESESAETTVPSSGAGRYGVSIALGVIAVAMSIAY
ncbi:hypothetical protein AK830_g431 [Neonectria ditissima]|uniref:Yeast cell wall synthesis Kre9/Knh1-like N-terminal domain-containing protein n=1 Tax=Neonectria ditissima TaxID=78410 RepID=A0A0P7BW13_9HYPO|nr:hypothetical protein AK830_g431 [Neonectria ditissima]